MPGKNKEPAACPHPNLLTPFIAISSNTIAYTANSKLTVIDGKIDMDRLLEFLTEYNEFINHKPKPFKPMVDREMKL